MFEVRNYLVDFHELEMKCRQYIEDPNSLARIFRKIRLQNSRRQLFIHTNYKYLAVDNALISQIFMKLKMYVEQDTGNLIIFLRYLRSKIQDVNPFLFISVIDIQLQ